MFWVWTIGASVTLLDALTVPGISKQTYLACLINSFGVAFFGYTLHVLFECVLFECVLNKL